MIRAWLGRVPLTTTNVYAEVDMETKAKELTSSEVEGERTNTPWKEDAGLIEFLRTLQPGRLQPFARSSSGVSDRSTLGSLACARSGADRSAQTCGKFGIGFPARRRE